MKVFTKTGRNKLLSPISIMTWILVILMMFSSLTSVIAETSEGNKTTTMVFIIDNSTYVVNGEPIVMDVSPTIIENRTMLPVRYAAEPLGADIEWDGVERKATISLGEVKLELWIGKSNALINGKTVPIDVDNANVKPLIVSNRTMLPLRFVTENLGCGIEWDPVARKATITKTGSSSGIIGKIPDISIIDPGIISDIKLPGIDLGNITLKLDLKSDDISGLKDTWGKGAKGQGSSVTLSEADIPIVQRIGRGYNVFDQYASTKSLKNAVLDVSALLQDQRIERIRFDHGEDSHIISESIRSYSNSRSTSLGASGSYFGFGGSVKTNFDSSRTKNTNNYFATSSWVVKKYGVYVKGGTDFKKYLTADAKKMLNDDDVSATTIFDTFGHYVLVDTITGGRVDYNVTASSEASTSFENFKAGAKAGFNAVLFSAGASGSYQNITNKETFDNDKDENLISEGGAFVLNISQLQADPMARSKWESTLEDQGTLVEFGSTTARPLIPIWELCDDWNRAMDLKTQFGKLNIAEGNKWPMEKYLTGIYLNWGLDRDQVLFDCPEGYVMIPVDLNEGITSNPSKEGYRTIISNYIFLGYKLEENPNHAFTDFFMEFTDSPKEEVTLKTTHNGNTANYTRWAVDLNMAAHDTHTKKSDPRYNYIYLWYTKDKTLPPIKEIKVVFDEHENPAKRYPGWQVVSWKNSNEPADANRRAIGGVPVYILVRR